MAIENFTTYTEEDTNNKLTVAAAKAEGADVDRDEDVYLYKDRGADHFDALDIDFELYVASTSVYGGFAGIAIANTVGSINDFAATDIACVIYESEDPPNLYCQVYLVRGNFVDTDQVPVSTINHNTIYYCTMSRDAGNDTVTLKIYSDAERTVEVDTLTVSGFGVTKYQYVYGFINRNDGNSNYDFDGYVENLDLKEVVSVGRSFGFITG